jgi:outer membrane protein insertion porin family
VNSIQRNAQRCRIAAGRLPVLAVLLAGGLGPLGAPAQAPTEAPAPASAYDGRVIRELRIEGLRLIDEGYVRNQLRTAAGQPYSAATMSDDIGRLLRTGRFLDAQAVPEPVDGEVDVVLRLVEKPIIAAVEITGNVKFNTKELLKLLDFAVGDPVDRFLINQGRDAIERKYRDEGYAYVEVTVDEAMLRDEQVVAYRITEGPRVRVREIMYEGNVAYTKRELDKLVSSKSYIPIFRTGDYDPDLAERDAANIQTFYREHGFLEAEVSYRPEFIDAARENLRLVFVINEGIRYVVREIRILGNAVFTDDEIGALMNLREGMFFDAFLLKADKERIEREYGQQGYIYAAVTPSRVFAEEPEQVILTLNINEGNQYYFGRIEINGNETTQDKCVIRELRFYPEDVYDTTKTKAAEERLRATQLFTEATITPVGNAPDVRDAVVTVTENPRTNNLLFGIGVSSDSGAMGNIVVENTNFDIADWPRDWGEFFKGRAFRGAGQTARIELQPGTEVTRFRIDFREPYLLDQPYGLSTSVYYFERDRDSYDEERLGFTWSLDHRFESGALKDWTAVVRFRNELVDISDRKLFAAKDIRDAEGSHYISSVEPALIHNTTDSVFNPSRGHRLKFAWEQAGVMGGDYTHAKLTASYAQHWTIRTDAQDRKDILSMRGSAGYIAGDAPVFERFYAGGIGSMRGFDFRGISPRDGLRNDRIGGEFELMCGAEYTFPLYEKIIRGVVFLDMGTVERELEITTWRAAVGAGIRLTLPFFGTIPMEFDLAYPVLKDDADDERYFSFYIGLPFF